MPFRVHSIESAPDDSKASLELARERFGFTPNLMGMLASAPATLKAYLTLGELVTTTSLTPQEQQVVLLTVSRVNSCPYCTAAHTWSGSMAGLSEEDLAALREQRRLDDFRLEALRQLASGIVAERGHLNPRDVEEFLSVGFTPQHALEVVLIVAMGTVSNYANHLAKTPLDDEFKAYSFEAVAG